MTNDGFHAYTYDAEGHTTAVDTGSTASYVYNALNQRVQTTVGSTVTEFVFNAAGQRVSTWNGSTNAQIQGQYYWGSKPVGFYKGGAAHFQHQDWLGTERMRTTYNGSVEGSFTSLPFGDDLTTASGTDTDAYHTATLDHDAESETDHAQFRQYNNDQGRWMAPDPYSGSYDFSNPQSMNRYVYVGNSPLSSVDPQGLLAPSCSLPMGCGPGGPGAGSVPNVAWMLGNRGT
jgi:RHS repeat-associated protein